jgi:hypothetical protein
MNSSYALQRWLAAEVLGKRIPRKPPQRASLLKSRPFRSYRYRSWIKSLPSAVSGLTPCDPCHTGPHGYAQKASDLTCIPLTRQEHEEYDANPKAFCVKYELDLPDLVNTLNQLWLQNTRRSRSTPTRKPGKEQGASKCDV